MLYAFHLSCLQPADASDWHGGVQRPCKGHQLTDEAIRGRLPHGAPRGNPRLRDREHRHQGYRDGRCARAHPPMRAARLPTRSSSKTGACSSRCTGSCPTWSSTSRPRRTSMTCAGAIWCREAGADRVTLSRELSVAEIKCISQVGIDLEIFAHGSICSPIPASACSRALHARGRSANRGMCAQPCRLPYELLDESGRVIPTPGRERALCRATTAPPRCFPSSSTPVRAPSSSRAA